MGIYRHRPPALKAGLTTALCGLMAVGGLPTMLPTLAHYGLAAPAQADPAPLGSRTVSLDVAGADLHAVVSMLQHSTQLEFTIQDGDKPFKPVTVGLHNASLAKALRTIALSAGATVAPNADGVYVFRPLGSDATPSTAFSADASGVSQVPVVSQAADVFAAPVAAPPPQLANTTWRKLTLQHAIPSNVLRIMHWDDGMRILDPYDGAGSQRLQNTITTAGNYVNTEALNGAPSVPIGRGYSGASEQANRSVDPYAQAQQAPGPPTVYPGGGGFQGGGFPGGGFQGGGFQGGGFPGGGFQGGGFQGGGGFQRGGFQGGGFPGGGGFQGGAGGNQQQNLPEGVERIYALEGDNSLFIQATPDGFNRVRDIVKNLDIAPRQVQIKVEFVTSSVTDVDAFGINFDLVPYPGVEVSNNQGSQANLTSGGVPQTFVQVASGNIVAQLFSSLVNGRGKVVEAPLITTTNNVPAFINVSQQIPYVTTTNIVGGTGNTVSNNQQNFLTTNTGLSVSPRINSDDTVTLNLQPTITDIAGSPSVAGGPPPTTTQSLQTLRTVLSGETMVLGGLVRKADTTSQSRMPILGSLPIIGNLFRNHVKNVTDSELLIFVTPTIIGERSESEATSAGPNISVAP